MISKKIVAALSVAIAATTVATAAAQQLRIAAALETAGIDPHISLGSRSIQVTREIFDPLILQDDKQRLVPGLALRWIKVDDTTWELALRPGVKFHDGGDFSADDVAFTIDRAAKLATAPGQFGVFRRVVSAVEIVSPFTVRIKTHLPYPQMPNDLTIMGIISRRAAAGASTEDFNSGKAAIGTGPFRFVEWQKGDRAVFERNESYWGGRPPWQRLIIRTIPVGSSRVAALLANDVDVIEQVPPESLADLRARTEVRMSETPFTRVIFLALDQTRDRSPFVFDRSGQPLQNNPFKDWRVRKAISKAINRAAITDRLIDGAGVPAGQILPAGFYGASQALPPEPFDLDGARQLLANAGYPTGFALTLHAPNNRNPYDEKVAVALAQMLSRIGIETKVETMPNAIAATRAAAYEFSVFLDGWASETGESGVPMRSVLGSVDPAAGWGTWNRGRYSNPAFDRVLAEALRTMDDEARDSLLRQAIEVAVNDVAVVPLFFQVASWAMRRNLRFVPRSDGYTLAHQILPAP